MIFVVVNFEEKKDFVLLQLYLDSYGLALSEKDIAELQKKLGLSVCFERSFEKLSSILFFLAFSFDRQILLHGSNCFFSFALSVFVNRPRNERKPCFRHLQ
jgi:hypothetical protein